MQLDLPGAQLCNAGGLAQGELAVLEPGLGAPMFMNFRQQALA